MLHLIFIILANQMQWCHWWWHWHHMTKKVMLHLLLIIFTLQMDMCYWWHCWHHVTLTPASMASNDQKSYVKHRFLYLDLIYTVVLLTMPFASHDADASANSVKWLKKSCCISFWSSWISKCKGANNHAMTQNHKDMTDIAQTCQDIVWACHDT